MFRSVGSTLYNNDNPPYFKGFNQYPYNPEIFSSDIEKILNDKNYEENILTSDNKKAIWSFHKTGLYHQFGDNVSVFFDFHLKNKNKYKYVVLLINTDFYPLQENEKKYTDFIFKMLEDLNIKYYVYKFSGNDVIYAKNFYVVNDLSPTKEMITNFKNIVFKYLKNKNIVPFRKVYLSRRHIVPRPYHLYDGLSTSIDNRIVDDLVLESFLADLGFEIIVPEEFFNNFEDQIQYMYETKLLVSLTSSGLANMLFMQPNTTCIEFVTTFPSHYNIDFNDITKMQHGEELLHLFYSSLSYLNNTNYMAINNYYRMSNDIISTIENNKFFNFIFKDNND